MKTRPYGSPDTPPEGSNPVMERLLSPRYLCVLQNPSDKNGNSGVSIQKIEDSNNNSWVGSYLFIAYTAEQFSHSSEEDMQALHTIAETATRAAGLPAYWVGCSCMPDEREMEDDVFRISDVIRGAAGLCIAVGPSHGSSLSEKDTWDMLRQWGSRLWTFPEVLLSPKGAPVTVYRRGQLDSPLAVPKNQFAKHVWADAAVARQLVDHYEGNLTLSRLELDTIALRCLHSRATTQYLPGDHSYALMGLLRVRPRVDHTDSAFQAFARLSLANDSNMLLERLVCTLPKTPAQHWSCVDDAWDASLWDIQPQIQIAGICDDDAIIVDNALGAAIRWKSFAPVKNLRRTSWKRLFAQLILHSSGILLIMSFFLFISPYTRSAGIVLFLLSFPFIAAGPHLLRMLYQGKFWYSQPWFFGFEGYMDVETIESQIWGARLGRLEWSAFGSPLARHCRNEHGERIGVDPTSDPKVAEIVEGAKTASPNEQRVSLVLQGLLMLYIVFTDHFLSCRSSPSSTPAPWRSSSSRLTGRPSASWSAAAKAACSAPWACRTTGPPRRASGRPCSASIPPCTTRWTGSRGRSLVSRGRPHAPCMWGITDDFFCFPLRDEFGLTLRISPGLFSFHDIHIPSSRVTLCICLTVILSINKS